MKILKNRLFIRKIFLIRIQMRNHSFILNKEPYLISNKMRNSLRNWIKQKLYQMKEINQNFPNKTTILQP